MFSLNHTESRCNEDVILNVIGKCTLHYKSISIQYSFYAAVNFINLN